MWVIKSESWEDMDPNTAIGDMPGYAVRYNTYIYWEAPMLIISQQTARIKKDITALACKMLVTYTKKTTLW
jgi:hypothetical protein